MIDTNVNLGAKARVESALYAALDEVWEKGQADGNEHIVILCRKTGEVWGRADGGRETVEWPLNKKEVGERKAIVVHNHPLEGNLSITDIEGALMSRAPCYAITPQKAVSWVDGERTTQALWMGPDLTELMALEYQTTVQRGLMQKFGWPQQDIRSVPEDEHKVEIISHLTNLLLDKMGLINYRFHFPPEVEARIDATTAKAGFSKACRSFPSWRDRVEVA